MPFSTWLYLYPNEKKKESMVVKTERVHKKPSGAHPRNNILVPRRHATYTPSHPVTPALKLPVWATFHKDELLSGFA